MRWCSLSGERTLRWLALGALLVGGCSGANTQAEAGGPPVIETTTAPSTTTSTTVPATTTWLELSPEPAARGELITLTVDGVKRSYVLYVPAALGGVSAEPHPLVVDLHGLGSDPDTHNAASRMRQLADVAGFAVAQPSARGGIPTWNGQPDQVGSAADVTFVRAMVDDISTRHSIDPAAVFASGFSNGAGMANRLGCDAADVFAAIGTVSGQYPLVDSCDPSQAVAVIAFHGTDDRVVPIEGVRRVLPDVTAWVAGWADRNGCAPVPLREQVAPDVLRDQWTGCDQTADVVFYTVEEGPHAWPGAPIGGFFSATQSIDATDIIWQFFASHTRR